MIDARRDRLARERRAADAVDVGGLESGGSDCAHGGAAGLEDLPVQGHTAGCVEQDIGIIGGSNAIGRCNTEGRRYAAGIGRDRRVQIDDRGADRASVLPDDGGADATGAGHDRCRRRGEDQRRKQTVIVCGCNRRRLDRADMVLERPVAATRGGARVVDRGCHVRPGHACELGDERFSAGTRRDIAAVQQDVAGR